MEIRQRDLWGFMRLQGLDVQNGWERAAEPDAGRREGEGGAGFGFRVLRLPKVCAADGVVVLQQSFYCCFGDTSECDTGPVFLMGEVVHTFLSLRVIYNFLYSNRRSM